MYRAFLGTYANGYSFCVRPICLLENGGVSGCCTGLTGGNDVAELLTCSVKSVDIIFFLHEKIAQEKIMPHIILFYHRSTFS